MTEVEWLACDDPFAMLMSLVSADKASERKFRLFGVASCRRVWKLLKDGRRRKAVELAEAYADALPTDGKEPVFGANAEHAMVAARPDDEPAAIRHAAEAVESLARDPHPQPGVTAGAAAEAVGEEARETAWESMGLAAGTGRRTNVAEGGAVYREAKRGEQAAQAALMRDLFNPFRPVRVDRAWLRPAVTSLATAAYEERSLPSGELDPVRLAVLADALEDAGCTSADLLGHLRSPGPHVRGCWALDQILGKG
jgi:hypothetical protein